MCTSMHKHGSSSRTASTHTPSHWVIGAQNLNLFVWIWVHAHIQQWLLVIPSTICSVPHLNSIILLMSFCCLAHCKCFWVLQQELNTSQVVLLLPDSYAIIMGELTSTRKTAPFPVSFSEMSRTFHLKTTQVFLLVQKSRGFPQSM